MARIVQLDTDFTFWFLIVAALPALCGCEQQVPDPVPVAMCSAEAPDICWSEAKQAADRTSDEAVAKFEIACDAEGFKHRSLACTWAGLGLQGNPEERERAIVMHERGCDLGIRTSCAHLGALLMGEVWSNGPQRPEAGEALARIRSLVEPVCESDPLSGEAKEFGADPRAHACATLAPLHEHGFGVPKNPEIAFDRWNRACELGSTRACTERDARAELMTILTETQDDMKKRADDLLAHLNEEAAEIEGRLGDGEVSDKEWVKEKLSTMFEVDQLYRKAFEYRKHLDEEAWQEFQNEVAKRVMEVDAKHLAEFKEIVEEWGWTTLSEFGPQANDQAWLIVQHADRDVEFQETILDRFSTLREEDEIQPSHYAYLYDRVAVNQERKQRYGTQGRCVDGAWEPRPMEKPEEVDERRADVGLQPMSEYKKMFEGQCR